MLCVLVYHLILKNVIFSDPNKNTTIGDEVVTKMATVGNIGTFDSEAGSITTYLERVEMFLVANDIEAAWKAAVLLTVIGAKSYGVLHDLASPASLAEKSFDDLKKLLKDLYEPKPNTIAERYYFHKWDQKESESIHEYAAELKLLATKCDFEAYLDQALRDRFVCGLRHEPTQKRLLTETKDKLTFTAAVDIAKSVESIEKSLKDLKKKDAAVVGKLSRQRKTGSSVEQKPATCQHCGR